MKNISMLVGFIILLCSSTDGFSFYFRGLNRLCDLDLRRKSCVALSSQCKEVHFFHSNTSDAIKESMKGAYSRASSTYDRSNAFQTRVAHRFIDHFDNPAVMQLFTGLPHKPTILEIGCGTGVATEMVVKKFSNAQLTASDISPEMIAVCRIKLANKVKYEVSDGESLPANHHYDMIVSSLCFHLFKDPPNSISELRRYSKYIALTFPLDGSLDEWRSLCNKFGLKTRLLDFPKKDIIAESIARSNGNFKLIEEVVHQDFAQTSDFLNFLRDIGSTKTRNPTPSQKLKVLPLREKFSVTYNMGYLFVNWNS